MNPETKRRATAFILTILLFFFPILLVPGYVLTFDMSWGPNYPQSDIDSNTWLLHKIIGALGLIEGWIPQKIILFLIFFMSSYGMFRLVCAIDIPKLKYNLIPYFGALVYVFNPFVYTRFVTGQWQVLLGYALLPWLLLAVWKFLQKPGFTSAWPVLTWLLAVGFTSIHTLGIAGLAILILALVSVCENIRKVIDWGAGITLSWLVLNVMWIVPLVQGTSSTGENIQSFGVSQLEAFATSGTIFDSPALSALFLTGFWADGQGRYSLPSDFGFMWYGAAFLLLLLVIIGSCIVVNRREKLGISLLIAAVISWVLAVGVSSNLTAPITSFLYDHIPLYAGYREPHKWLMLLAIAYAYLGSVGLAFIVEQIRKRNMDLYTMPVLSVAIILPILFAPNLAWGASGQLKSVSYPAGWKEAAEKMEGVPSDAKVAVLPWHMYMHVDFADRIVANPVRYYFKQDMVVGNDPELKGVSPAMRTELTDYISYDLVPVRENRGKVSERLESLGVSYIMLLKEADYQRYGWLNDQPGLNAMLDNESLILYRVN